MSAAVSTGESEPLIWPFGTRYAVVRPHGEPIFFAAGQRERAERSASTHARLDGEAHLVRRMDP